MDNRFRIYAFLIAASALLISFPFIFSASAQKKSFQIDTAASCITASCHADLLKKKYIHVPAADGTQCADMCHQPVEKNSHEFTPPPSVISELCYQCHDENTFKGSAPHTPVSEGKCTDCHNPHSSDNSKQLVKPVPDLCFECHNKGIKDTKGVTLPSTEGLYTGQGVILHQPFAQGKCLDCHYPHPVNTYRRLKGSYPDEFYTSYSEDSYSLCLKCHQSIKNALKEPRTLTDTRFRNGNLSLHYRHVNRAKGRTCKACHDHHGSINTGLIRDAFSFGSRTLSINYEKTETGGSCASACHSPVKYDRCEPEEHMLLTTPREGSDASKEELIQACEKQKK